MKTLFRITIIMALILASNYTFAQGKIKFGHIDSQILIDAMPEKTQASNEFQKYASDLEESLAAMQKELETKLREYELKKDSLSAFLKSNKEEELQMMYQRIEEFKVKAQQDFQLKEAELLQPVVEKAKAAINEVAKEQGLIYVFDVAESSGGMVVLYYSDDSVDILPLVKTKLGIK